MALGQKNIGLFYFLPSYPPPFIKQLTSYAAVYISCHGSIENKLEKTGPWGETMIFSIIFPLAKIFLSFFFTPCLEILDYIYSLNAVMNIMTHLDIMYEWKWVFIHFLFPHPSQKSQQLVQYMCKHFIQICLIFHMEVFSSKCNSLLNRAALTMGQQCAHLKCH